ncbi:MAG: T9SS type A sorting domain-containing protein [Bacteroidota bacterium]
MRHLPILVILILAFSVPQFAQTVNYSEHIAPIIYKNCTTCHREGEVAPMPLTSYEEVKNWSNMIQYVTSIKYMPPWKPNPNYSKFLGENFLTNNEIKLIADWVEAGTPQGDPSKEPPLPFFPDGSQLGEPDLVLSFDQSFLHKGNGEDDYRIFVLPTGLTEDKSLAAIELRPGNRNIVHHALFTYDITGRAQARDAQDSQYGYNGFGGFGVSDNPLDQLDQVQFPGYVPGQKVRFYPKGIGQKLPANSDLLIQMHYAPIANDQTDSSTVNIFFKEETVQREVQAAYLVPLPNIIVNGPFFIRPNEVKRFECRITLNKKVSLISITPHMHLLGRDWEVYAQRPNGERVPLIKIDDWDFNWQGSYYFDRFIVLEPGTTIHAFATYDNTSDNPFNPNSPPQLMTWGEKTSDEMFYLPITYVDYQEGDEEVVFEEDQTTSTEEIELIYPKTKLYPIYPNPTSDQITVGFSLAKGSSVSLQISDLNGRLLKIINEKVFYPIGQHQLQVNTNQLTNGNYVLTLIGEDFKISEQFQVVH